jgi:N-acetylglucosaminyl-diphospho-decaprenol L-rhamnosyltransferase
VMGDSRTDAQSTVNEATSVDVVIAAFNRFDLTESCLRHLQAQTVAHEVFVIDNGSTDGTSERLRSDWPTVHILRLEQKGFAEASNRGAAAGSSDVIVLLNNDVECRPDFLERLIAPLQTEPSVGSVASLMLFPDEETIDSVGLFADVTLTGSPRLHGRPAARAACALPVLAGPAGAAGAYRRAAWEQVGGLDERIFAYMEDLDLALRLRAAGWATVAAVDAAGIHLGSATHGRRSVSQRRHFGFGRGYLLRRYRVLHGRHAPRTLLTEALVTFGDVALSRDLASLHGRIDGWRAARRLPPLACPPAEAVDSSISFADSLAVRRAIYWRRRA